MNPMPLTIHRSNSPNAHRDGDSGMHGMTDSHLNAAEIFCHGHCFGPPMKL